MPSTISAGTTSNTALNVSADTSGVLAFQTNGTTNAMTIDTSQNVGIGTTSPTDSASFTRALDVNGSGGAALYTRTNGSATSWTAFGNFGADGYINNRGTGTLQFYNNGLERMRIDSSGRLLTPYQPAFMARTYLGDGSTIGGSVALRFGSIDINRGNHFNNTTGIFTCPVAGDYFVYFNFNLRATVGDWTSAFIIRNSTIIIQSWSKPNIDFEYGNTVASCVLNCAANDTIALARSPSYSAPNTPALYNHASIYLLG